MTRIKLFVILMLIISGTVFAQKNKIAYCSMKQVSGFIQIFTMNEDGSDKKQLTDIQENRNMKPKWSADGKQIVFYSDRGYIYLLRNAGTADKKTASFLLMERV